MNLIGQRFGKGSVFAFSHRKGKSNFWRVKCDCRNIYIVSTSSLRSGNSKSCGCGQRIAARKTRWKGYKDIPLSYYNDIKRKCLKIDREFKLSINFLGDLFEKQNKKCSLTGISLHFRFGKNKGTASLDRIDSSLGYIEGNVQFVHKDINKMKSDFNQQYFINVCKSIARRN